MHAFASDGRDLHLTLPVAPWEAALGAVVTVDLPDERASRCASPKGTQSGRQMRVRGKGIPGEPPGDLLLEMRVVLPPADSRRKHGNLFEDHGARTRVRPAPDDRRV
jgi:curved DNA-binding protein